jgi:hypothetical protein
MNNLHNKASKRIPFCGFLSKFAPKNQKRQLMKRILIPFAILFSAVMVCTSCLKSDDDDTVYYDDTAITTFTLGTLKRTVHTTSSKGADSTYTTTLTGSDYQFYIDQEKREIYNPDSLPYGTDVAHVICTVTAKNGGVIALKSVTSDSLRYYSSTDSIDFSTPRQMVAYANSGKAYRAYTVHVNVHQEEGEVFNWSERAAQSTLAGMKELKAVACNDHLYVFGQRDGYTVGYATLLSDGSDFTPLAFNFKHRLEADAYQNLLAQGNNLFLLDKEKLLRSTDGQEWITVSAPHLTRLLAVSSLKLYGMDAEGKILSSADNGTTWIEEPMGDEAIWLPQSSVSYACFTLKTNTDVERVIVTGNRDLTTWPNDGYAMVWGKLEDLSNPLQANEWTYYTPSDHSLYRLPSLANLSMFAYDDVLIAFGGSGVGACTESPFSTTYVSKDGGITWKGSTLYPLPSTLKGSDIPHAAAVDSQWCLWIINGENGQVWRGRMNRLGWKKIQKEFQ